MDVTPIGQKFKVVNDFYDGNETLFIFFFTLDAFYNNKRKPKYNRFLIHVSNINKLFQVKCKIKNHNQENFILNNTDQK